ncbi:MAG: hypothetical protein IJ498_09500 [Akkermansia sp.]|nr:hypothetical protein [Akkermansia sp.]
MKGWFLFTLVLFVPTAGCYFFSQNQDAQKKALPDVDVFITSIESKDFEDFLSAGNDLVANDYVNRLPYPGIREKAEELRERYNRRAQMIRIIDTRKREFSSRKLINRDVVLRVNGNLKEEKRKNAAVRQHYEKIIKFAEMHEAEALISRNSAMMQNRVKELEKENEELLKTLDTPQDF